jgi:DNA-binding transcriptional MerR regulator
MDRFTLNQLSFLSGLPQQTISFWDKKYNALGNQEQKINTEKKYSTDDLHRILNISLKQEIRFTIHLFMGKFRLSNKSRN